LEDIMLNVMYDIPSRDDIEKCIITRDTILNQQDPILILSEGEKPRKALKKPKEKKETAS
ncbi:MAG TPA: ATP-dependent Clp protease ATP-binding subunit ClpX, partial [Clostridiales bacterium]|nr:ATP-dependent Clp protease ATP-binding subunit ClpX [Clostridiales bacterium]